MTGHFDKFLNLRQIILDKRPNVIVECGAGNGDCTKLLAHLKLWYPFELYSITDKRLDAGEEWSLEVDWKIGLSYERLLEFEDNSIGLCIIDTDHNYWTLRTELDAVKDKMEEGGLIVMHDVDTFYHDTGMAMSYWNGNDYPEKQIMDNAARGGLGNAVIDFLHDKRGEYKMVWWNPNHHGVAVIEKKTVSNTNVIRPGTAPVFAQKTS